MNTSHRLLPGLLLLGATLTVGTLGFAALEGWSLEDSLFQTMLVTSTLGFQHYPTRTASRLLTVAMVGGGVGTLYYVLGAMAHGLIEAQVGTLRARREKKQMEQLKDHVIVCGYGRVGQEVVRELRRANAPFVLVDCDGARVERLREEGCLVHVGDATSDETLHRVGIARARGLMVCTGSDAVNVFVTLSARSLREDIFIVARAIDEDDEPKLLRAGANRAITPTNLGGRRMAGLLLRPTVTELLDVIVRSGSFEMWLEEARLEAGSAVLERSLGQSRLREDLGITVLAIKRASGTMLTNPPAETRLERGDVLVALGTRDALAKLEELAG